MPAPKIAGTIRSKNPLKGAVEVLPVSLSFVQQNSVERYAHESNFCCHVSPVFFQHHRVSPPSIK